MIKRIFPVLAALAVNMAGAAVSSSNIVVTPSKMEVTDGRLDHFMLFSPQLGREVEVDVWLPSAYDAKREEGFPVIYMHDGQNLFDASRTWNHQAWEIDSVVPILVERGSIDTPIVVGVYSQGDTRVGDLMPNGIINLINPTLTADGIAMMCPGGVRGDDYVAFLAETLKPVVDSLYNTASAPESTSVMGSSMGGLISLGAICTRPDVFGSAACMSTHITGFGSDTLFPTVVNAYLIGHLPLDGDHRIYVDTGDHDIDAAYLPYFEGFVRTFRDLGYSDGAKFKCAVYPGHCHREDNWKLRVEQPLLFLLGKD